MDAFQNDSSITNSLLRDPATSPTEEEIDHNHLARGVLSFQPRPYHQCVHPTFERS